MGRFAAIARSMISLVAVCLAALYAFSQGLGRRPGRKDLIWGVDPLINFKYWSRAMRQAGWESKTLMTHHYPSNQKDDFDLYYDDLTPSWMTSGFLRDSVKPYFALAYILKHAAVFHMPYTGGPLRTTWLRRFEAQIYRLFDIKTVILPYGSDAYMYSRVVDPSLRNALLKSYPSASRHESDVASRLSYWNSHADCVLCGFQLDGQGRWDVPLPTTLAIDTDSWRARFDYSDADGKRRTVRVLHTPNHRGYKGTEFLVHAVEALKQEGLDVELVLLEGVSNDRVRDWMQKVDILAEQFIFTGYALSAVEGMASGLPVIANLEDEHYTRVFRRYAFLDECPILSATPETLKDRLRVLITQPRLREELGRAGRAYAEKYCSYETSQYLFGSVYDKILHGKDVDLMDLFHPLKSEFNRRRPRVRHPLYENCLPPAGENVRHRD